MAVYYFCELRESRNQSSKTLWAFPALQRPSFAPKPLWIIQLLDALVLLQVYGIKFFHKVGSLLCARPCYLFQLNSQGFLPMISRGFFEHSPGDSIRCLEGPIKAVDGRRQSTYLQPRSVFTSTVILISLDKMKFSHALVLSATLASALAAPVVDTVNAVETNYKREGDSVNVIDGFYTSYAPGGGPGSDSVNDVITNYKRKGDSVNSVTTNYKRDGDSVDDVTGNIKRHADSVNEVINDHKRADTVNEDQL